MIYFMKKHGFAYCIIFLLLLVSNAYADQNKSLASRVLVVSNSRSPISVAIANDYIKRRGITNAITVSCPDGAISQDAESIDYPDYVAAIETPLRNYLNTHTNIDFIVFTKGIPIRVYNTPGMPYGGRCSLDSRISALGYLNDATSSIINVTDPNYGSDYVGNAWANKYWNSDKRFSHSAFGGYLVTRLDGYTQADAIALTTRALEAEKNLAKGVSGKILLDACSDFGFPNLDAQPYTLIPAGYKPGQKLFITHESEYGEYNSDMLVAKNYLSSKNIPVLYDDNPEFVGNKTNLAGYTSWGSNDTHYDAAGYNGLTFAPGAIGETAVSTSARTFLPTSGGQSLIDDLIKQGITGVKGYTDEPLLQGIASPSVMFNRYTRGWTLAESFYAASRLIGWEGMVVGDPIAVAYIDPTATVPDTSSSDRKTVLYPNPNNGIVHINVDGDYSYKIYDASGKLVKSNKLIDKQINVNNLNAGVYVISFSNGTTTINKKLIRQN